MAEASSDNKTAEVTGDGVKSSDIMLKVTTLVVAVALITVVALLWINFRKDSKVIGNVAVEDSEDGQVLAASTQDPNYLVNLALALKADGYILYGSSSDESTKQQKEIFGQGFSAIDYVECDPGASDSNPQECLARGIDRYPTWIKGDQKFPGNKSLNELEKLLVPN